MLIFPYGNIISPNMCLYTQNSQETESLFTTLQCSAEAFKTRVNGTLKLDQFLQGKIFLQ